ncbi:MAG: class I SAM-dependent methyltransferase [Clostridiales bacterium]|jgi:ubiquinone/menaquinone biosynthesis C-methylase UbiE|nr:class I SAM-dependent methyltransferase [Clostridiales bacterium]
MNEILKYWDAAKDEFSNRDAETLVGWKEVYPMLKGYRKILDIGCGIGNVAAHLNSLGFEASGVTYQQREVEAARELGRSTIIQADMHELPFEDNAFDLFFMWDSLEHAIAPLAALKEAKRVTRTGGRGCIFIPGQRWIECEYHIIVPTIRQMRHLLWLAGLELTEVVSHWGDEQAIYCVKVTD